MFTGPAGVFFRIVSGCGAAGAGGVSPPPPDDLDALPPDLLGAPGVPAPPLSPGISSREGRLTVWIDTPSKSEARGLKSAWQNEEPKVHVSPSFLAFHASRCASPGT